MKQGTEVTHDFCALFYARFLTESIIAQLQATPGIRKIKHNTILALIEKMLPII